MAYVFPALTFLAANRQLCAASRILLRIHITKCWAIHTDTQPLSDHVTWLAATVPVPVVVGVESISRLLFAIDSHCTDRSLSLTRSVARCTVKYLRITVAVHFNATKIYGSLFFSVFIICWRKCARANASSISFAHSIYL